MRANPKPAFLVVPSGKVIGKTYRVKGNEMPGLIVKTERELASDDAMAAAKRARKAADKAAADAGSGAAVGLPGDRRRGGKGPGRARPKAAEAKAKAAAEKAASGRPAQKTKQKSHVNSGGNR